MPHSSVSPSDLAATMHGLASFAEGVSTWDDTACAFQESWCMLVSVRYQTLPQRLQHLFVSVLHVLYTYTQKDVQVNYVHYGIKNMLQDCIRKTSSPDNGRKLTGRVLFPPSTTVRRIYCQHHLQYLRKVSSFLPPLVSKSSLCVCKRQQPRSTTLIFQLELWVSKSLPDYRVP